MPGAHRSGQVGALFAAGVQGAAIAAGGFTSLVIARELGADGTGVYAVGGQFVLAMMMLGGLGLRSGIAYELSAGRLSARAAAIQATVMSAVFGLLAGVAGFALYEIGSESVFAGISEPLAIALSASVPFAVAWWVLAAIPLAEQDYGAFAVLQSGTFVVIALLVVPLALAWGIEGALAAQAGAFAIAGLASVIWAVRHTAAGAAGRWELADSLRVGLRGWILEMLQLLTLRPDVIIVAAYGTAADVGVYSLAVTITTIGWILPQGLGTVALPRVAASVASSATRTGGPPDAEVSKSMAERALRHGVLLALGAGVLVAGLLLLAPLIFGSDFDRTVELGMIMLPGVIALALGRVFIALMLGLGRARAVLRIGISIVPAALVAYLLVVPGDGPTGAATVSAAAYLLTTAAAALALRRSGLSLSPAALLPRRHDLSEYTGAIRRLLGARRPEAG